MLTGRARTLRQAAVTAVTLLVAVWASSVATPAYAQRGPALRTGKVTHHTVHSEVLGADHGMNVYTPPQYDGRTPLPTTYVLPGGCVEEGFWPYVGATVDNLDVLFTSGRVTPQIVVFPSGEMGTDILGSPLADPMPDVLVKDVVPFVDHIYRTLPLPQGRAVAGVSCGGVQALNTLVQYPGRFSRVGLWSTGWFPQTIETVRTDPAVLAQLRSPAFRKGTRYLEGRIGELDTLAGPNFGPTLDLLAEYGLTATRVVLPGRTHFDANYDALTGGLEAFYRQR